MDRIPHDLQIHGEILANGMSLIPAIFRHGM
jgi:hypothetical protein